MGIHIEALILFILIFLSGSSADGGFSAKTELVKIFMFYIPSIALIWHIILNAGKTNLWIFRFGKKDITAGLVTFPCLLITGFAVALSANITGGQASGQLAAGSPSTVFDWTALCISCIAFAYLEESYFRFYILTNRESLNLNVVSALALSAALFSICHISGGPWSFLNAAIGGTILGFMFLRYNSFHGIAIAHSMYNIAVYIINSRIN